LAHTLAFGTFVITQSLCEYNCWGADAAAQAAGAGDVLPESADRVDGFDDRECRGARDPGGSGRATDPAAVDHRYLHAHTGEPADARGRDGGSVRAAPGVPDRLDGIRTRLAGVQPRAEYRNPHRSQVFAGDRRVDAESGCDVDHYAGLHREG